MEDILQLEEDKNLFFYQLDCATLRSLARKSYFFIGGITYHIVIAM